MDSSQTQQYYEANPSARVLTLIAICIGSFLTPLSVSAVLVAVPAIAADLKLSAIYVSWLPVTFVLSNLIMMVPAGRLADRYGRKKLCLLGLTAFGIGSLCAGLSDHIGWLLFFRGLQGAASACFFSSGFAIIGSLFRNTGSGIGRGTALGWMATSVYLGLTCGPLIGGWLTDEFGWRAVFFFSLPFIAASLWLSLTKMKGEWRADDAEKLDVPGALLLGVGFFLLFVSVSNLHLLHGWVLLGLSITFFCLFARRCARVSNPVLRIDALRQNTLLNRSLLAAISMYSGHFSMVFIVGLFLQFNMELTPTVAGQVLLLQALMMAVSAPIAGRLSDRSHARYLATAGCALNAIAFSGFMVFLMVFEVSALSSPLWPVGLIIMVSGIGHGLFATPNNSAVLGSVPESRLGIASAMLNQARTLGQMLGSALIALLLSLFIGQAEITPEHYPAFLHVTFYVTGLALVFAIAGAVFSFLRAKVPLSG